MKSFKFFLALILLMFASPTVAPSQEALRFNEQGVRGALKLFGGNHMLKKMLATAVAFITLFGLAQRAISDALKEESVNKVTTGTVIPVLHLDVASDLVVDTVFENSTAPLFSDTRWQASS